MSIATSSTLTQEFVQMLSGELLYLPDSEWLFANLAAAARDAAFAIPEMDAARGVGGFGAAMGASTRPQDGSTEMGRGFCKVVQGPATRASSPSSIAPPSRRATSPRRSAG